MFLRSLSSFVFMVGFVVSLATQSLADSHSSNAQIRADYSREIERLSVLAKSNPGQFVSARDELKAELEARIETSMQSASKSDGIANQYRDLALSAENIVRERLAAAQENERSALDFDEDDSFRQVLLDSAKSNRDVAAASRTRAQSRRALAAEWRSKAEKQRDTAAALRALIEEIERFGDVATASQEAREPAETVDEPTNTELGELLNPEDGAHPDFSVEDAVGLWRPASGAQFPMVIVQKNPSDEAFPNDIEVHTGDRVWNGEFTNFPAGDIGRSQTARMVVTYQPEPAEMNPDIPDWVTAVIDGQLIWRLEIDETGPLTDSSLKVKWYRGEVRWNEAKQTAWIEGDGVPLIFTMEFEPLIDITQSRAAALWLEPIEPKARSLDPSREIAPTNYLSRRITDIIKHQPFKIKVRLPPELAMERGPKLTVEIKTVPGGDTTSIELTGPVVTQTTAASRGIIYTHSGEVTLADRASEPTRDPQFMSLGYLAQAWTRSFEEGKRLDIVVDNGEAVEFDYDGAGQRLFVWNNHIQHGLSLHQRTLATFMGLTIEQVRDSSLSNGKREAAVQRWRLLQNYRTLMARDDLLEIHKFLLGELYLSKGVAGTQITCFGADCSQLPWDVPLVRVLPKDILLLANDAHGIPGRPSYFTDQLKLYIEILQGEKLTPVALRIRDEVSWVNIGETNLVALTLKGASDQFAQEFQNAVADIAYAIPKGLTEDVSILLFQENLKGKKVSDVDRALTLSKVVAEYLMNKGAALGARELVRFRQRVLRPIGRRAPIRSMIHGAAATQSPRALNTSPDASVRQAAPDLPDSVSPQQAGNLAVQFRDDLPIEGEILCKAEPHRLDGLDASNLSWQRLIQENLDSIDDPSGSSALRQRRRDVERSYRGMEGVEIEEIDVFGRQEGGTCVGGSTAYQMNRIFNQPTDMPTVMRDIAENMHAVNEVEMQRLITRVRDLRRRILEERSAGRSDSRLVQLEKVAVRRRDSARASVDATDKVRQLQQQIKYLEDNSVKMYQAAAAIRRRGGQVVAFDPVSSMSLKLKHLQNMNRKGFNLVVTINRTGQPDHAVAITKFEMDGTEIGRVYWYDSAHDVILSSPASVFDKMIARRTVISDVIDPTTGSVRRLLAQPIVLAFKGDADQDQ